MAETKHSLRETRKQNPDLQSMFNELDQIDLILSLNYPIPLRFTTESYMMVRGPRYRAYAELRETRLKTKSEKQQESEETEFKQTQTKKKVKCSSSLGISRRVSSVLAQSVPDISINLRKENQKSPVTRGIELTPPPKNLSTRIKSSNAEEKKGKLTMIRKSTASINGQNRGGKSSGIGRQPLKKPML